MSWKLDDIDFKDFGVAVSKASGVLDMPRMVDVSIDWLDQNGRDFWQDAADVKYMDREILLICWMIAGSYSDFRTKVAAFYAALTEPGERTLTTSFGNTIEHVTVEQSVQMLRRTQYLAERQVGGFTLRLKVAGDSLTKQITVYRADGVVRGVFDYRSDARLSMRLQGEDQITYDIELNDPSDIGRDDYIVYNGSKYIAFEYPEITKYSTNKLTYKCSFQHEFFRLKDVQFRVLGVAETAWYATLEDVVDKIVENMERRFPGVFVKGAVENTIYINHQFSGQSCYDVLTNIAAAYELEYGYRTAAGVVQINVQVKVGEATGLTFAYGKASELFTINRLSTQRDLMCTHLYAYGSTRNVPTGYRGGGKTRIELPTMPMVHEFYGIVHEVTKTFDEIFPHRTGTVTSYAYTPSDDPENYPERATYKVVDGTMPFDLKAKDLSGNAIYLISGTTAKMHFNSGDCAGFEFEILDYDHTTKTFSLVPLKEANGLMYPSADIFPANPDEYVLIDIKLPQSYIDTAEAALEAAATAYQNEYWAPKVTFKIITKQGYDPGAIYPGDTVTISDPTPNFGTSVKRIIDVTRELYSGIMTITAADIITLNNRQKLVNKVEDMSVMLKSIKIDDVNNQRRSDKTVGELKNALLNPIDEKLKADDIVRDESIDARMLSYEAGVPQFEIEDALVTVNVDNDEDKVSISAGTITMLNWREATLSRKEIAKLVTPYDPTRTWTITATDFTLATKSAYNIYAKLDMTAESTSCTIELFTTRKRVREGFNDPGGYIRYKIGSITSGEEV